MPDWTKSMQQTFEYYVVDPGTWKDSRQLKNVKKSTINRDYDSETLGSATIDITESVGECYIRVYLITIQNGIKEKHPLGTFLVQTPSSSFNGKIREVSMDAYTPLLELKENPTPVGYSLLKGDNIMEYAYRITREHLRAPVVKPKCDDVLHNDFVANTNDTWLSFVSDLVANAKYYLDLDELGRVMYAPKQDMASLQPVWTYTDDNSSILYPDFSVDHDLYGIPNVVEIVCSYGSSYYHSKIVNDDPNSPTSTVNRGREITKLITDPEVSNYPTQKEIDEYAEKLWKSLSTVEYSISYTHGYCPTRVGDCVRLNYKKAGISNVKAKVVKQSIDCRPGCPVSETAVFPANLWR